MEITGLLEKDFDEQGPDLDLGTIFDIHRGDDGFVAFMQKTTHPTFKNGRKVNMENLGSVQVSKLKEDFRDTLPGYAKWFLEDSYFSLNSMFRAAPYPNKVTGLNDVWRKEPKPHKGERGHLRYLNVVYVDLDVGRPDSDRPEQRYTCGYAIGKAVDMMDRGELPPCSKIARSGRGVYLLWLVKDEDDPLMPPRAYYDRFLVYKEINKAIISRTTHLAADENASDGVRVFRFPGSVHTGTNKQVRYLWQTDDKGQVPFYTLENLATFFGVSMLPNKLPAETRNLAEGDPPNLGRWTKKKGSCSKRKNGRKAMYAKRAADQVTIEQYRGGFRERGGIYSDGSVSPGRRRTITFYAKFLRAAGDPQHETLEAVQTMAANCKPAYPSHDDDEPPTDIVRGVYKMTKGEMGRHTAKKLCTFFGVSDDLAWELDLKTIITETVRLERKAQTPTQGSIKANRRRWILGYVEQHPLPSGGCRGMARLLNANGFNVCFKTVNSDLNALFPQGPGTRAPLA